MLRKKRISIAMISTGILTLAAGMASSQDYPNKPVHIITGGATGASGLASRLIAQGISGPLGQSVVVENRGSGAITPDIVGKAPADGYTLLVSGSGFWLAPLMEKMPYDPVKGFAPITLVGTTPQILVVHPSLPVRSVKELIALAKARPGQLNYSIGGVGGPSHLGTELFKSMAGVDIVRIPYASGNQEIVDLVSGRVQMSITTPSTLMEHVKLGKLRALAVTSLQPSTLVPDLPTLAASGLPGYESVQALVMFAPAKTPEAITKRLNQEIVRFLKTKEAREQFFSGGIETVGSSQEELAATTKAEMAKWSKVIKDAGIPVEK